MRKPFRSFCRTSQGNSSTEENKTSSTNTTPQPNSNPGGGSSPDSSSGSDSSGDSGVNNTIIVANMEDIRIAIKVEGDPTHVTIVKPEETITVVDGTKWKDVKKKAAAKVSALSNN